MDSLTQRQCSDCGEWKSPSEFYRGARYKDGYRPQCKKCRLAAVRAYEQTNSEKKNASNRRWYWRDPERAKKHKNEWQRANPERANFYASNRRARVVGSGGDIAPREWADLKDLYSHTCLCCKRSEPEIRLTLDHVKPLAIGGENTIENAQPLCKSCNSRKGKKWIDYR